MHSVSADYYPRLNGTARRVYTPCGEGQMVWRCWGEGRPLVLIHGGHGSWTQWLKNIDGLAAAGHQVWAPDLPGFGDSALPPGGDAIDAANIAATVALGLRQILPERPVDVMAFSFGAVVAGLVAAEAPERVRSLVVVGAAGLGFSPPDRPKLIDWRKVEGAERVAAHRANLATLMLVREGAITDEAVLVHGENSSRYRLRGVRNPGSSTLLCALNGLATPVAGIWGSKDVMVGGNIQVAKNALAAARQCRGSWWVEGAGHWVQFDAPEQFHDAALEALAACASISVPNSAGTSRPQTDVPLDACDSHVHIYDPALPRTGPSGPGADGASVEDYRLLQNRLGTSRVVVVNPRYYGTDNRATLNAVKAFGLDRARAIAVVDPAVSNEELVQLRAGGAAGLRLSMHHVSIGDPRFDQVDQLAARAAEVGLHMQLHWTADQFARYAKLVRALPSVLVIDHIGRLPAHDPTSHPAYAVLRSLLDGGRTWMKLSGCYLDSHAPKFEDMHSIGADLVEAAPERMVWGSDWPHVSEGANKPNDAELLDLLQVWAPESETRKRILVDNPAELYNFDKRR